MKTLHFAVTIGAPRTLVREQLLGDEGGHCEVAVDVQTLPDFEEYMNGEFPRALARLKARCEAMAGA